MRGPRTQVPAEYGVPRTLARLEALPRRGASEGQGHSAALTRHCGPRAARPAPGARGCCCCCCMGPLWGHGLRGQGSRRASLSPCNRAQVLPRAAPAAASRERAAPEQGGLPPAAPPPGGGQGALSAVEQHGAQHGAGARPGLRRVHLPRVAARQPKRQNNSAYSRGTRGQCLSMRECARMVYPGHIRGMTPRDRELSGRVRFSRQFFRTFLFYFSCEGLP